MFDGRLQVYRRGEGKVWQCAARVGGRRFRSTTKEMDLDRAKDIAEEWYLDLRGKLRGGQIVKAERTFRHAAEGYLKEVRVLAAGTRSPLYVEYLEARMRKHILPFFGGVPLSEINRGLVQRYRVKRAEESIAATARPGQPGKPPARNTMLQEIVHIRQTLKWAEGMGWIPFVPNLAQPYMSQGKKGRRAWFSPEEYEKLFTATRRRIEEGKRPGFRRRYEDMHDFVLFMANTGLRPDEALRLELRDVAIEFDAATKETILLIDVRGKTGVGYCKSTARAVHPFNRLRQRRQLELELAAAEKAELAALKWNAYFSARRKLQEDLVSGARPFAQTLDPKIRLFPRFDRSMFNKILGEEGLKYDRDGQLRTAYSLRHTYISMRLMEGANIHQIANNCRTSVKMIEEHYAFHIKDRLDASAINVVRPKAMRARKPKKSSANANRQDQSTASAA
jgi:integrase